MCACKRCLIGLQKGVSKDLKGHLLQAKRALIQLHLSIFYFCCVSLFLQNMSGLSILISRIHKHINGSKKGGVRERGKERGCV